MNSQYDIPTSDQWQVSDNANTLHCKPSPILVLIFIEYVAGWSVSSAFGEPSSAITLSTTTQTLRDIWPQIKLYSVYLLLPSELSGF